MNTWRAYQWDKNTNVSAKIILRVKNISMQAIGKGLPRLIL